VRAVPRVGPVSLSESVTARAYRYTQGQRLRGADVKATLASARRLKSRSLTVQVRVHPESQARLGLIVPKRYLPRAVDRNRAKRLVREWFRLQQHALTGQDILVRVTAPPPDVNALSIELRELARSRGLEA
jgi:ribonuclease P protein component